MRHVSRTHRVARDDEWNHLLCLLNISHFSSTVSSAALAKLIQQESGEE